MFEQDAKTLRGAMKGLGTDEETIINVIGNRNNAQRMEIMLFYKTCFGRDLIEDLKDELGGYFETVAVNMFRTPVEFDAHQLRKAMKGGGTNEEALIEILGSRSNSRIKAVKEEFKKIYDRDLEADIMDETSGDLKRLLVSILQCNRSEDAYADPNQAQKDAQDLYEAGEAKWGTDESVFNRIFSLRSPAELVAMAIAYQNLTGKSVLDSIESEFSGDTKELLKTIAQAMIYPSQFFASRIRKACKGWGTDDGTLVRILISRDEIDLPQIKAHFQNMYGESLEDEIKDECSGDYQKILLAIARH